MTIICIAAVNNNNSNQQEHTRAYIPLNTVADIVYTFFPFLYSVRYSYSCTIHFLISSQHSLFVCTKTTTLIIISFTKQSVEYWMGVPWWKNKHPDRFRIHRYALTLTLQSIKPSSIIVPFPTLAFFTGHQSSVLIDFTTYHL